MVRPVDRVATEIEATLDRAGFENLSADDFTIDVTDTFQRRFGECRPLTSADEAPRPNRFEIRIARRLFKTDDADAWRDTVRHEVAHAAVLSTVGPTVAPHGEEWQTAARRAGAEPTARYEHDHLADATYVLACPNGCFERGYLKRSARIKHPWEYACGDCEEALASYDADGRPASIEPGTCYVASIPWRTEDDVGRSTTSSRAGRYLLACPNGCVERPYQRRTDRIKYPWRYRCPECDSRLVSCDRDDDPTAFSAGTCNVASIEWRDPRVVLACPEGCFEVGYVQHTMQTRQPGQYRCEDCGTQPVVYPPGQRPTNPTPGTDYTEAE